jgi:hypothetical protein
MHPKPPPFGVCESVPNNNPPVIQSVDEVFTNYNSIKPGKA